MTCATCGGEHHVDDCRFNFVSVCKYIPNCKFFPKCRFLHQRCKNKMECRDIKCQYHHTKREREFRRKNRHLLVEHVPVVESDEEDIEEEGQTILAPRQPLPNLSAGCLDPCLAHHHIPIELRRKIDSYYCAPLTDENIRTAALGWCISDNENYVTSDRYRESYLRFGHISLWDTSKVTDMGLLFSIGTHCYVDENIEYWDVSKVTNMHAMFDDCCYFNHPLWRWNVSACTNMQSMFWRAHSFNQPLSTWDVSNVASMSHMFGFCNSFDCFASLMDWNVHQVENVYKMFYRASFPKKVIKLEAKWKTIVPDPTIFYWDSDI